MSVKLELLKPDDENQFILDNQYAFKYGAEQYFSQSEMKEEYEEEEEIISRKTIYNSIDHKGSIAYRILEDKKPVGGIVINLDGDKGDLELFFVNPNHHSKGIGHVAWKEIERIYFNIKVWETVTPCFEKRNIHFYVNKLGFHIVAYYNEHYPEPNVSEDMWEMFKFQKLIK